MKKAMIDYTKNEKHDHFDTPAYAMMPLLPYIRPEWTVWEPTDTHGNSQIAGALRRHGCKVLSTCKGSFDFLTGDLLPAMLEADAIVTNPPYTLKDEFIARCYDIGKPWAMLMPLTALEGIGRGKMFRENGVELLVLDRRVEFTGGSCWFATSWFASGILPRQIIFAELDKKMRGRDGSGHPSLF